VSVFAGILHLDGAPGAVDDLAGGARPPAGGWDQDGSYAEGPFAFHWQYRWMTPESAAERLPIICPDQRFVLSYSGRLDNRDELIARYRASSDASDGALLAATLARDGAAGLRHAVGDFVLAAWDRVDRRLWLARDAMGQRPLYYSLGRGHVMWSTDLAMLRDGPARASRPNAGFIAEFLNGSMVSHTETAFDAIHRVPPAHALSISPGQAAFAAIEYWMPPTSLPPRRPDADLIDEFRERFGTAVLACLRAREPAAAELSGGLDSSSIVALASEAMGRAPDTYSIVYPGAPFAPDGEPLDETAFIDLMNAAVGAASFRHDPRVTSRQDVLRVLTSHRDLPDWPNADLVRWPMVRAAAAAGHRVMLTGLGGDQWLTGTVARLPSLVGRGHLRQAWRFFREATAPDGLVTERGPMLRRLLAASAPSVVKRAYRAIAPARPWPSWLGARLLAESGLAARLRALPARVASQADPVLRDSLTRLFSADGPLARESLFVSADDAGMEARHPFFDRRFVEFTLTLPDELRFRDGQTRYILRRAMGARLPGRIAARRDKSDSTILLAHAVRTVLAGDPLRNLAVADRGWVDGDWMRAACAEMCAPGARVPRPRDLYVWTAVAVELWLRASEGGG
jgi:asparagine synthase (glutamine-hydrolysing)